MGTMGVTWGWKTGTMHALYKLIKSNATLANMFRIIASECS